MLLQLLKFNTHHPFFPLYVGLPSDSLKKFKLSIILIFETFVHDYVTQYWEARDYFSFMNGLSFCLWGNSLCLLNEYVRFHSHVEIRCVLFFYVCMLYLNLYHYFFALIQGFYLNFSIIQYWYKILCHSEGSFRLVMTFVDTINHSGWQFFPVWSITLFHLCLFYW